MFRNTDIWPASLPQKSEHRNNKKTGESEAIDAKAYNSRTSTFQDKRQSTYFSL